MALHTRDVIFSHFGTPARHDRGERLGAITEISRFGRLVAILISSAFIIPRCMAGEGDEVVAISATASSDYVRTKRADGSYVPEPFAFGIGGVVRGVEGGTKDLLDFREVAETMALPLANRGYVSSSDPARTRLLIMVYWGTTRTPETSKHSPSNQNLATASAAALAANHPQLVHFNPNDSMAPMQVDGATLSNGSYALRSPEQVDLDNAFTGALAASAAEDEQRTQVDIQTARMLGFDSELAPVDQVRGTALEIRRQDLINELEENRYFVVLMAYDFPELLKHKRHKLLWEVRFSIRERNNDIRKVLTAMAVSASRYFGENTGKLVRSELPEGHVKVGPTMIMPINQEQYPESR